MSLIMDNRLETVDKDEEVKKLQALVKKLELQNEELRLERQTFLKVGEAKDYSNDSGNKKDYSNDSGNKKESVKRTSLENLSTVKLEDPKLADEETWLLDSPRTKLSREWLRRDVDDPSLTFARKCLINKLDVISKSPRGSPRRSFSPSSSSGVLSPESPSKELDTRTFLRPKKKQALGDTYNDENRNSIFSKGQEVYSCVNSRDNSVHLNGSREYLLRSNGSLGSEEEDRLSSASDGSYSNYRLADVEDVNTVARLQEESLKDPEPRCTARLSENSTTSSQEDLIAPHGNKSSPRRYQRPGTNGLQPPRRYPTQGMACRPSSREGSDVSTPSDSPYNSQTNLDISNGRGSSGLKQSVVGKAVSAMARRSCQLTPGSSRGGSPATVEDSHGDEQSAGGQGMPRSRVQVSKPRPSRLSAPSPVRVPLGSPQVSEIPRLMNSAIPRPGSRIQAPRSRIGQSSPRRFGGHSEDWREGCY